MKVEIFRKLLMVFFWGTKKNRKKFFDGTRQGLDNMIYQTKQSEFGHLGGLILTWVLAIPLLWLGRWEIFAFISVMNIVGNLYPVILQRNHRIRLERIVNQ